MRTKTSANQHKIGTYCINYDRLLCQAMFPFRPENTHKGSSFGHQANLNLLYWSKEGKEILVFSSFIGDKCRTSERIPCCFCPKWISVLFCAREKLVESEKIKNIIKSRNSHVLAQASFLDFVPFFSLVVLFQRQLFPSMTSQAGAWLLVERILTVQLKNIQLKELTIFTS